MRSETVGKFSDVYSFSIIMWELLHNELAWKRSSPRQQKNGINARLLVEMVAYRRVRPPIKERVIQQVTSNTTSPLIQPRPFPFHSTNAVRIHPQAFTADSSSSSSSSSSSISAPVAPSYARQVGIHPHLAQLLRECWREDYRRRPTFNEIVNRLTQFREMIREQRKQSQQRPTNNYNPTQTSSS